MLDSPSPGDNASQPDVFVGSQPGTGQLVGTPSCAWPCASAGVPANPYSYLNTGLAGPDLSYIAAAAQRRALLRPVLPGQQPGQFCHPSMSADLRPASAPGFALSSLLAAIATYPLAQVASVTIPDWTARFK